MGVGELPTNRGYRLLVCAEYARPMSVDEKLERRSRLSFMHWPTAWLWIAVITAVALLITVGLAMGAMLPRINESDKRPRAPLHAAVLSPSLDP